MKLLPERKTEWLAALRSGDYAQAQRQLRTRRGFCCLGVACDLVPATVGKWEVVNGYYSFNKSAEAWPREVVEHYFDNHDSDEISVITQKLMKMNDNGYSFNEIADRIEREL